MHFFKPFFLHFFLNFFWNPFFGTLLSTFFGDFFSISLLVFFGNLFWHSFGYFFLWEWTFIVTILSTLKCYRTLLCTFFGPPFNSFCFFTLLFSTLLKMFRGGWTFFWQHLMSSKKCLNFFQTSFRSFSYHFLGTLFSCQEQLNRWPTMTYDDYNYYNYYNYYNDYNDLQWLQWLQRLQSLH